MVEQFFATLGQPSHRLSFATAAADMNVNGTLWGGNLAMLVALLGTPYFPDVRGGILFLEDVNEPAYKIERMLLQLLQAGVLARQRAVLLGRFHPVPRSPADHGYTVREALAHLRAQPSLAAVPFVSGLPFGHVPRKATLPVGAPARLEVRDRRALLSFSGYPRLPARS
jgi:muramoyltetrapeptide carboxypeptidase